MKKLIYSFKYAFHGIPKALKSERNLKIHFVMMILVICFGFLFQIDIMEWLICFVCFGMVIMAELFNTAIETVVDLVSPEKNEFAGRAKDISAGAVLFAAIISAIIGLIIFIPKIMILFMN